MRPSCLLPRLVPVQALDEQFAEELEPGIARAAAAKALVCRVSRCHDARESTRPLVAVVLAVASSDNDRLPPCYHLSTRACKRRELEERGVFRREERQEQLFSTLAVIAGGPDGGF